MNSFFFFSSELIVNRILIVSIVVNKIFSEKKMIISVLSLDRYFIAEHLNNSYSSLFSSFLYPMWYQSTTYETHYMFNM